MEGRVVREHHQGQVILPVRGGVADVGCQELVDLLVCHLCLAVTLGVIGSGGGVSDLEKLKEIFGWLGAELFSLVGDYLHRHSELEDLSFKNGRSHREGFLVGDGHHLSILGEGVSHAEDVLLAGLRFERPKQISVHSLLWLGALGQRS